MWADRGVRTAFHSPPPRKQCEAAHRCAVESLRTRTAPIAQEKYSLVLRVLESPHNVRLALNIAELRRRDGRGDVDRTVPVALQQRPPLLQLRVGQPLAGWRRLGPPEPDLRSRYGLVRSEIRSAETIAERDRDRIEV